MRFNLFKGKSTRTKIFTLITLVSTVILLALNLLLTYFGQINTIFFDMTDEGFYSLTDALVDECSFLASDDFKDENGKQREVTITFCNDPDYLISSTTTRIIYFMALKLSSVYPNVNVRTVNVRMNPTAVAEYKTTSLSTISPTNIIVSEGQRYRITDAARFWNEGTAYEGEWFYNGEYRITTLIKSVTRINAPKAYFLTGHGETYYDPENPESEMSISMSDMYDLLVQHGLDVKTLDLSDPKNERVPEDCALLIINNPTVDFSYDEERLNEFNYVSETEKLDRYLVMKQGAIMVSRDYKEKELPVFDAFLYEWGFKFGDTKIADEENTVYSSDGSEVIVSQYNTDEESYAYALYGDYAALSSAPVTVFGDAGYIKCSFYEGFSLTEAGTENVARTYASFLTTSKDARQYAKDPDSGEYDNPAYQDPASYDLAAVSVRSQFDSTSAEYVFSYIFCVNSASFFTNEMLGNTSYANFDIVSSVVNNISRFDDHASLNLGGISANSLVMGGKKQIYTGMKADGLAASQYLVYSGKRDPETYGNIVLKENEGLSSSARGAYTVLIAAIPTAVLVLGTVVFVKRRYL